MVEVILASKLAKALAPGAYLLLVATYYEKGAAGCSTARPAS
jgi:hypothetical protein